MIRVVEIFGPTVQGEGALIGRPTVFVRTGGCDYRCTWCDTLYAVLPEHAASWRSLSADEIVEEVLALSGGTPILVSLSGGNPAMQKLGPLLAAGRARGLRFSLETQGSLPRDWFRDLDYLFLSPKPPSSGETPDWEIFQACLDSAAGVAISLKVTVFDAADYDFARALAARHPEFDLYLQVGNPSFPPETAPEPADLAGELMARYRWLVERLARDRWYAPTVLPQLHVLAWGNTPGH